MSINEIGIRKAAGVSLCLPAIPVHIRARFPEAPRFLIPSIPLETNSLRNPVSVYKVTNVTLLRKESRHLKLEMRQPLTVRVETKKQVPRWKPSAPRP